MILHDILSRSLQELLLVVNFTDNSTTNFVGAILFVADLLRFPLIIRRSVAVVLTVGKISHTAGKSFGKLLKL